MIDFQIYFLIIKIKDNLNISLYKKKYIKSERV